MRPAALRVRVLKRETGKTLCTRYWATPRSEAVTEPNSGKIKIHLHLHRVRRHCAKMAGPMSELQCLEHTGRKRSRRSLDAPLQERGERFQTAEAGRGERARGAVPAHR